MLYEVITEPTGDGSRRHETVAAVRTAQRTARAREGARIGARRGCGEHRAAQRAADVLLLTVHNATPKARSTMRNNFV